MSNGFLKRNLKEYILGDGYTFKSWDLKWGTGHNVSDARIVVGRQTEGASRRFYILIRTIFSFFRWHHPGRSMLLARAQPVARGPPATRLRTAQAASENRASGTLRTAQVAC